MGFGQNFCRNMAKRSYQYDIEEVDGKMITLSDGKRHRLSSCILVDKFAGGEY